MHILIADDHNLVRESLKLYIEKLAPKTKISEANDFPTAMERALSSDGLDIILLDLVMPGMDGLSGIGRMRERFPEIPVVLLSGTPLDDRTIKNAIKLGAKGFIPKSLDGRDLVYALDEIHEGRVYLPKEYRRNEQRRAEIAENGLPDFFPNLTKRESQVLDELIRGLQNKEIADELGITEITVKIHVTSIFKKLGVENRTQALRKAMDLGWLTQPTLQ